MNKTLKISTVLLIVFAIVTNLYTSLFSFYGIKTNNLQNSVWANALETTSTSGGDTAPSGTSSNGGSGTQFNTAVHSKVWCGDITFTTGYNGNGTAGASGNITNPNGSVSASVGGGYVNSTSYSGTIGAHWGEEIRCTGPLAWTICQSVTGVNACI